MHVRPPAALVDPVADPCHQGLAVEAGANPGDLNHVHGLDLGVAGDGDSPPDHRQPAPGQPASAQDCSSFGSSGAATASRQVSAPILAATFDLIAIDVPLRELVGIRRGRLGRLLVLLVPGDADHLFGLAAGVQHDLEVVDVAMPYSRRSFGAPVTAIVASETMPRIDDHDEPQDVGPGEDEIPVTGVVLHELGVLRLGAGIEPGGAPPVG